MRRSLCTAAATATMALVLAGPAAAQTADRDCPDFATQAEAQAALTPGDPERLDRDGDGIACEDGEGGGSTQASGGGNAAEGAGELPFTGPRENAIIAATGTTAVVLGVAMVYAGRRRTAE